MDSSGDEEGGNNSESDGLLGRYTGKQNISQAMFRFFESYGLCELTQLAEAVQRDKSDTSTFWRFQLSGTTFTTTWATWQRAYNDRTRLQPICEFSCDFNQEEYETVDKSIEAFELVMETSNIDPNIFVKDMFDILHRKLNKVNSIVLQGPANSGKSLIVRPLTVLIPNYGQVMGTGADAFAWENCVDRRFGLFEEPVLDPCTINPMKIIMEGGPLGVNVKYSNKVNLRRLPLIITTNHDLWLLSKKDKVPIQARMKHYLFNNCPELINYCKPLNPNLWKHLFSFLNLN